MKVGYWKFGAMNSSVVKAARALPAGFSERAESIASINRVILSLIRYTEVWADQRKQRDVLPRAIMSLRAVVQDLTKE